LKLSLLWNNVVLFLKTMRILILADIHANLTAFQTVLADVEQRGKVDEVWCLGDVVGYGPDPHECIVLLQKVCQVCIAGNHDLAAIEKIDTSDFNPRAAEANQWTAQQLTKQDIRYLGNLPLTLEKGEFTLAHGSPRDPIWEYLFSVNEAVENLPAFNTPYCLVGHTHQPLVFSFGRLKEVGITKLKHESEVVLGERRLILNPGGVGQPRDGDPRTSYGIYDSTIRTFTLYRVAYDIKTVQSRMREHGLPEMLIARLEVGR
jgi:diadenosine tetraphosphatase ApaH/serine/threonine PP2A family protein phosphatase